MFRYFRLSCDPSFVRAVPRSASVGVGSSVGPSAECDEQSKGTTLVARWCPVVRRLAWKRCVSESQIRIRYTAATLKRTDSERRLNNWRFQRYRSHSASSVISVNLLLPLLLFLLLFSFPCSSLSLSSMSFWFSAVAAAFLVARCSHGGGGFVAATVLTYYVSSWNPRSRDQWSMLAGTAGAMKRDRAFKKIAITCLCFTRPIRLPCVVCRSTPASALQPCQQMDLSAIDFRFSIY